MRKIMFVTTLLVVVWMEVDRAEVLIPDLERSYDSELADIAEELGIEPNWLDAVIAFESGRNPRARNKWSGAVGLIQFLPETAVRLGTDTMALAAMDTIQQMRFVQKYLQPFAGRMNSMMDVYLAVFFPAAIGRDDDWVLQAKGLDAAAVAAANPGLDINKDGRLQVFEINIRVGGVYE